MDAALLAQQRATGTALHPVADAVAPDRCLVVRGFWLDRILTGQKTLDIRGCQHKFEGPVYLLESKSGRVRGIATLGAARALTPEEMVDNQEAVIAMNYKHTWAWPITGVVVLTEPWLVSVQARQYCPTWVPRVRWEAFPSFADPQAEAPPAKKQRLVRDRVLRLVNVTTRQSTRDDEATSRGSGSNDSIDAQLVAVMGDESQGE